MFKNIPVKTIQIMLTVFPLVAVIALFILVGKFGFSKISDVRSDLSKAQKDKNVLSQKLETLKTAETFAADSAGATLVALPESNSSLAAISQIKLLAAENSVLISGLKSGGEIADKSGLSRADISFEVTSPRAELISFVKAIGNIAPISLVDRIKLTEFGGSVISSISVKTFWSALPTKLPSLTTQTTDLTPAEIQTLAEIENLRKPVLIEVAPSGEAGRSDPFSP